MAQEQESDWTLRKLCAWTTDFLAKKGFETPKLEAEILLAYATGMKRIEIFMKFDDVPSVAARAKFRDLVRRRAAGEPVAYLVGNKEFYSLEFDVDRNVLVPRPETEQLVLEAIEHAKKTDKTFGKTVNASAGQSGETAEEEEERDPDRPDFENTWLVADVGTGSGCIGVAIAKQIEKSAVYAVDVSPEALEVAKKNAQKNQVDKKITFVTQDLLSGVPADLPEYRRFDMIIANPPYVSEPEYDELEPTVKNYEPRVALVGGPTGAELPIRLVDQAVDRIKSNGMLFLELSPTTVHAVAEHLIQDGRWTDVTIKRDFAQLERYAIATRK